MIKLIDAIFSIDPKAEVTFSDEDINSLKWDSTPIANDIILAKQVEMQAEYNSLQYSRDRATAYPSITDQLDMLWHAMDTGEIPKSTIFYDINKSIKDKFPKE